MAGGRGAHPHHVHRAVLELGETILAEPDVLRMLKSAAEVVAGIIKTDVVAVLGLGSDQRSMRVLAAAGVDAATTMRIMSDQPDPVSLEAMRSDRVVVVRDLSGDRRFAFDKPSPSGGGKGGGLLSGITATINRSQQVFGVLSGRSWEPRAFTATQVHLVEDTAALLSRTLTRRDAERKLRESEERFRLLAERSPDVVVLTSLLPEPRLEYISPSIENLIGYSVEEMLHAEDRTRIWAIVHPDDHQQALDHITNPLATVQPLTVRWIHRNGSTLWMEQLFTPIFDHGVLVAIEGVIRDVTHRVLSEQRRQAQAEMTQLILEGRHADEILLLAAGHLSRLSGADYALLALPATGLGWAVRTIGGDYAQEVHEVVMPDEDPLIARVGAGMAAVMIEDLSLELPMDHPLRALGWSGSALLAPIRGSNGLLGVLGIANDAQGRGFSDIGTAALGDFARQAALAIEYGRAREELQRLAVLEDRARISRELHDGVIQSLFGAGMMLEGINETEEVSPPTREGIARVAQMIDDVMVDVRSYIFDLRPSALTGRNIEQGLRLLAEDFEKASSIQCTVDLDPDALRGLEGAAPQLIQIVREALSNVARHSRASTCWLEVHRIRRDIVVEIRDDGRGFKPAQMTGGRGLENIRRRLDQIGARLELISEPGKGSSVRVHIPTTRVLSSKRMTSPRTAASAKVET
jgi:PAS domain S-box-containing protein